jgi:predicted Ser/Thr protein kinase
MDTKRICPSCAKPLAADAPQGICPECLVKAGLGTEPGTDPGGGFVALSVDAVAKLFPQFEILALIGKGGMGAVYSARQVTLDRVVALKILPPRTGNDPGFAERFAREARALAKLSHPNIVAVYEFGQVDGLHYLIMEYVDGPNLRQIQQGGKLSPREALKIIPQLCEALQFAHDEGIVHRDIKPENVLMDKKGRVKIADFGLAKILGREPANLRLTGAKDVMGTLHYMAPEQMERPQEVDHRADIYSLGVVFYEMLTGELPLGRFAPPSQKAQIDVRLDEVVLRALEREPHRRYQHASEVKTDVENISTHPGDPAGVGKGAAVDSIAKDVKWPAIGLISTGVFNWVVLPLVIGLLVPYLSYARTSATAPLDPGLSKLGILCLLTIPFIMCSFIIYAGFKMMRLESYGAAIIASVLSLLITPGNLIGLPIAIWALVTLARDEVRAAFRRRKQTTPNRSNLWIWLWTAVPAIILLMGFLLVRGIPTRLTAPQPARSSAVLRTFTGVTPISGDLVPLEEGGWSASCSTTQTFRLFEVTDPNIEQCILTYHAKLKSERLAGRAYLEMWCHFPGLGDSFSRGLDNVIAGSNDWASYETPFFLKAAEKPDRIRLNLVVEGEGKVFIKDVVLTTAPLR